jgi:hypothetical protein
VTARLTVRVAAVADLPALDRAVPTGRNDVHRAFLARQATGEVTYLTAWRGGSYTWYDETGAEHEETEHVRVLTLALR